MQNAFAFTKLCADGAPTFGFPSSTYFEVYMAYSCGGAVRLLDDREAWYAYVATGMVSLVLTDAERQPIYSIAGQ